MNWKFTEHFQEEINQSESQFIHWFKNNVDDPANFRRREDGSVKEFLGELDKQQFWMEKKELLLMSALKTLQFDLTAVRGRYEYKDGKLVFNIWVMIRKKLRNVFLGIMTPWIAYHIYTYIKFQANGFPFLFFVLGVFGLFSLWRVRSDAETFRRYLSDI